MLRRSIQIVPRLSTTVRAMSGNSQTAHDTAGSIRAAGDGFSKMEIAHEEEYFYKLRQEQLHALKEKGASHELEYREKAIRDHEEAINRHKKAIDELRNKK